MAGSSPSTGDNPGPFTGCCRRTSSTSALSPESLIFSLSGFLIFYSLLLVAELYLMFKYARLGPSSLGTGHYHFENGGHPAIACGETKNA